MGNKFAKLTDDLLAQVKQPKRSSSRFIIRDSLVAGFFVTVSSRSISYGLTVNEEGKRKAISLGKFPYLSVLKARQAALELQTGAKRAETPVLNVNYFVRFRDNYLDRSEC